jgi:hypothetical protein
MTDLSPAAQAVKDAFDSKWAGTRHQALIAALRAVIAQVDWNWEPCSQLLAIAAELEDAGA